MKFASYVKLFMLGGVLFGVYAVSEAIHTWEASSLFALGGALGFAVGIVVTVVIMSLTHQSVIGTVGHLKGALTPAIREDAKLNGAYHRAVLKGMDFSEPAPPKPPTEAEMFYAQHQQYR